MVTRQFLAALNYGTSFRHTEVVRNACFSSCYEFVVFVDGVAIMDRLFDSNHNVGPRGSFSPPLALTKITNVYERELSMMSREEDLVNEWKRNRRRVFTSKS